MKTLASIVILFLFSSCSTFYFVPSSEDSPSSKRSVYGSLILSEKSNVIVRHGSHRDNRISYFFEPGSPYIGIMYSTNPSYNSSSVKIDTECMTDR